MAIIYLNTLAITSHRHWSTRCEQIFDWTCVLWDTQRQGSVQSSTCIQAIEKIERRLSGKSIHWNQAYFMPCWQSLQHVNSNSHTAQTLGASINCFLWWEPKQSPIQYLFIAFDSNLFVIQVAAAENSCEQNTRQTKRTEKGKGVTFEGFSKDGILLCESICVIFYWAFCLSQQVSSIEEALLFIYNINDFLLHLPFTKWFTGGK